MKKIVIKILILLSLPIIILVVFLLLMTIIDVKPDQSISLTAENNHGDIAQTNTPYSIATFNIGYGGLDKDQDFFMDGSTMSRSSSEKQTRINLAEIVEFLREQNTNIIFLQEVDIHSSRSFNINQNDYFSGLLTNCFWQDLSFEHSDHNPVIAKFILKEEGLDAHKGNLWIHLVFDSHLFDK